MDPSTPIVDVPTDSGAPPVPVLLSIPDVAARLGLKVSWLQEKVRERAVPFVQIGKVSVGFTEDHVAQIVEALTVQPIKKAGRLTTSRAKARDAA